MRFGICFVSMLAPFWHQMLVWGVIYFFVISGMFLLSSFDQTWVQKADSGTPLFPHLFDPVLQGVYLKIPSLI